MANGKFLLVTFKTKNYPKHSQIFQSLYRTAKSVCLLQLNLSLNMDTVVKTLTETILSAK